MGQKLISYMQCYSRIYSNFLFCSFGRIRQYNCYYNRFSTTRRVSWSL